MRSDVSFPKSRMSNQTIRHYDIVQHCLFLPMEIRSSIIYVVQLHPVANWCPHSVGDRGTAVRTSYVHLLKGDGSTATK